MKPYVICHMLSSVDGRILPDRWHPLVEDRGVYERLHNELGSEAWLVGRVTGQEFASREVPYPSYTGAPFGQENWFAVSSADAWGDGRAATATRRGTGGWIAITGDPTVRVGDLVEVTDVDRAAGAYRVRAVDHRIDRHGFTTRLRLEGVA